MEDAGAMGIWYGAVLCFVVAAAAGTLFRFGMLHDFPWGLVPGNLRHAHSHLMFFSWVTPALMALWVHRLEGRLQDRRDRPRKRAGAMGRGGRLAAAEALVLGLLSFPFFLAAGYGRVAFLGAELPWATIISGVTMLAWYHYGAWYAGNRPGFSRTPSLGLFEVALLALGLATAGAWGRAALQFVGNGAPVLEELAVQLFLGAFTHGWMIVGTLGLAVASVEQGRGIELGAAPWLLLAGLLGTSLVGSAGTVAKSLGAAFQWGVGLSAVAFAAGLGWCGWQLARGLAASRLRVWLPFLSYLLLSAVSLALAAIPAVRLWAERMGLYIVYLHVVALGAASVGLITAANEQWGKRAAPSPWVFGGLVALLLVGVLSLTPLWPGPGNPGRRLAFAAWTSIPPAAACVLSLISGPISERSLRWGKEKRAGLR